MSQDNLRDATRKVAAAARRHLGPHPSPEELIAYQAGELSPADEARLQDHFSLCPECTATILDLASFPDVPLRLGAPGSVQQLVPPWHNVHARLQEEPEPAPSRAGGSRIWREKLLLALAATLLLATLGLSYRLSTIGPRSVEGDLPLFTLTAEGADRTRGDEHIAVSGDRFNLMLYVANPGSYEEYSLAAFSAKNPRAPVWRLEELVPTAEGIFLVVGLSRRELPPGSYHLRLYGGQDLLAEYQVLIEYD